MEVLIIFKLGFLQGLKLQVQYSTGTRLTNWTTVQLSNTIHNFKKEDMDK
jgi:hypothetical protein